MSAQSSSRELRGFGVAESRALIDRPPMTESGLSMDSGSPEVFIEPLPAPTIARIDLAAFRRNVSVVRSYTAPGVSVLAMIKANAYGHGMPEIAAEAAAAGVDFFGIARVEEGIALRRAGFPQRILLLELAEGERALAAIDLRLEITVASLVQAVALNALALRRGSQALIHVEVDTGMGRIGVDHESAAAEIAAIARLPHVTLAGVFSHFASSDDPDQTFAREQLGRFNQVLAELERHGVKVPLRHFANSGALVALPEAHFDMVRVGLMLYGYAANATMRIPGLTPVMTLQSCVSFIKTVEAGTPISYDRRYVAPRRTRIATALVGYGDGFSRLHTNNGEVLIRGRRYPVVGTVCMDMIMVDLGMTDEIAVGDTVTLIGELGAECITAWDVARRTGTVPYEVTCQIAERVPRVFVNASAVDGDIRVHP